MSMIGEGSELYYGNVGEAASTEIIGVMSVEFPETTVADVKDVNYKTADTTVGYIPGWKEGGAVSVEVDYEKAGENTLRGLLGTKKAWKVVAPDGGNHTFTGYMNKIGTPLPSDDKVVIKFGIKVCTLPVFAVS